jgi:hypothetical protein
MQIPTIETIEKLTLAFCNLVLSIAISISLNNP